VICDAIPVIAIAQTTAAKYRTLLAASEELHPAPIIAVSPMTDPSSENVLKKNWPNKNEKPMTAT